MIGGGLSQPVFQFREAAFVLRLAWRSVARSCREEQPPAVEAQRALRGRQALWRARTVGFPARRPAAQAAAVRPGLGRSNPQFTGQFALLDFATFFSLTAIGEMGFEELHLPLQHAPNFWIRGGCGL